MDKVFITKKALGIIYNTAAYDYDKDYTISELKRKIDDMRDIAIKALLEIK